MAHRLSGEELVRPLDVDSEMNALTLLLCAFATKAIFSLWPSSISLLAGSYKLGPSFYL